MNGDFLNKTQDLTEIIINSVPQHIFWKDINSVFMGCNKNFAKTVGLNSPEEIKGKTDYDLTSKEKAEHFIEIDKKVINEGPIYGMIELHKNIEGKEVWVNINKTPLYDTNGIIVGILGTFEDITARINLEDKLQKNFEKYRNLIESTRTAYVIMDTKFKITEINNYFLQLIECDSEKDIIGENLRSLISTNYMQIFDKNFSNIESQGIIKDLEMAITNNNNKIIYLNVTAGLMENGGKKILCLIKDISQKKLEEEIKFVKEQKLRDHIKQNIKIIREKLQKIKLRA